MPDTGILGKIIHVSMIKIILGILICAGIPFLINKPVLKTVFISMGFEEIVNRSIRLTLTFLILMPFLYWLFYSKLERRRITELGWEGFVKDTLKGLLLSTGAITSILLILAPFGYYVIE